MIKFLKSSITLIIFLCFVACQSSEQETENIANKSWEEILAEAKGSEVTMMMWQGDPLINEYMKNYVVPQLKEQYDISLQIVGGQGNYIVSNLMAELEAGKTESSLDMMWINGETFFQLRQISALYGPFVESLPNNQYINWENPFIKYDFQQAVEGYECPWGNVQMTWIYDSEKVQNPPQTMEELLAWVKKHPGKFTISNDFTGMTLLKVWLINLAGGKEALSGEFDEEKYAKYSQELWKYIQELKPYLWQEGKTFPNSIAQMHQLFVNEELWFTMSNNDSEVDNKIQQKFFSENCRAYVPEIGTIQNSHFLGIAKYAKNKAAALVVCNFLISPEAQWKKMQPSVWGDGTVLAIEKLPTEWQEKFNNIPGRKYAPPRSEIQKLALREPAPEYMIRLFEDFRKEVMEK